MAETKTTKKTAPKRPTAKKKTVESTSLTPATKDTLNLNPLRMNTMSSRTKRILLVIALLIILGVVAFASRSLFIAALVDGKPVSRLEVIKELEKQNGVTVLDRLIDKTLITQEAERRDITVTQEEIDKRRKEIVQQVSAGNEDNFAQILTAQGLTNESFVEELRIQILAEKMLGEIEVTDDELNAFLESNPDLLENSGSGDEARAQIKDQLKQQKLQTEYTAFMDELRKKSNVIRLVEY